MSLSSGISSRVANPLSSTPSAAVVSPATPLTSSTASVASTALAITETKETASSSGHGEIFEKQRRSLTLLFDHYETGFLEQLSCLTPSQIVALALPLTVLTIVRNAEVLSVEERRNSQLYFFAILTRIQKMEEKEKDLTIEEDRKFINDLLNTLCNIIRLPSKKRMGLLVNVAAIWTLKSGKHPKGYYDQPLVAGTPKSLSHVRATAIAYSRFISSLASQLIEAHGEITKLVEALGRSGKSKICPPKVTALLEGNAARVFAKIHRHFNDSVSNAETYLTKRFVSPLRGIIRICDSQPIHYGSSATFATHAFKISAYLNAANKSIEGRGLEIFKSIHGIIAMTDSLEKREERFDSSPLRLYLHVQLITKSLDTLGEFRKSIGELCDKTLTKKQHLAFQSFFLALQDKRVPEESYRELIAFGIDRASLDTLVSSCRNIIPMASNDTLYQYKQIFTAQGVPVDQFFPTAFWKITLNHYIDSCRDFAKHLNIDDDGTTIREIVGNFSILIGELLKMLQNTEKELRGPLIDRCAVLTVFQSFLRNMTEVHSYAYNLAQLLGGMGTSFDLLSRLANNFAAFGLSIEHDSRIFAEFDPLFEQDAKILFAPSSSSKKTPLTSQEVDDKFAHEQPMRVSKSSKVARTERRLSTSPIPFGFLRTRKSTLFHSLMSHVATTHSLNFYLNGLGRSMTRAEAARYDQLHCLYKVATMVDMFQCSRAMNGSVLRKSLQRTLFPKLRLDCYTAFERGDTAPILECSADTPVFHELIQKTESDAFSARRELQFETLDFRFFNSSKDRSFSEELMSRLLSSFLSESFEASLTGEALAKQIEAMQKEFPSGPWIGSVESPPTETTFETESKLLAENSALVRFCTHLQEQISELDDENPAKSRSLSRLLDQLLHFLDVAELIVLYPDQKFLMIPMEILNLSTQQIIESLACYLLVAKGMSDESIRKTYGNRIHHFPFLVSVSGLGKDLFDLGQGKRRDLYDPIMDAEMYGKSLNADQRLMQDTFLAFNIGKGGEYFFDYLARHNSRTASPHMLLLLRLVQWAKAESGFAPREETAGTPEVTLAAMRSQMCATYKNATSLILALIEHHFK